MHLIYLGQLLQCPSSPKWFSAAKQNNTLQGKITLAAPPPLFAHHICVRCPPFKEFQADFRKHLGSLAFRIHNAEVITAPAYLTGHWKGGCESNCLEHLRKVPHQRGVVSLQFCHQETLFAIRRQAKVYQPLAGRRRGKLWLKSWFSCDGLHSYMHFPEHRGTSFPVKMHRVALFVGGLE